MLGLSSIREKYQLVLFHVEQVIGVSNICSPDDLIEGDLQPLFSLLALFFYFRPGLER